LFVVGDEHYGVAHIAEETVRCIETGRVDYVSWPKGRKSIEIGDAVISNKKAKEILEWVPQFNLEKGLKETKAYYSNCLAEYLR